MIKKWRKIDEYVNDQFLNIEVSNAIWRGSRIFYNLFDTQAESGKPFSFKLITLIYRKLLLLLFYMHVPRNVISCAIFLKMFCYVKIRGWSLNYLCITGPKRLFIFLSLYRKDTKWHYLIPMIWQYYIQETTFYLMILAKLTTFTINGKYFLCWRSVDEKCISVQYMYLCASA